MTGSTLVPYWREQLGAALSAEQASLRGGALTVVTTDRGRVLLGRRTRDGARGRRVHALDLFAEQDQHLCGQPPRCCMRRTRQATCSTRGGCEHLLAAVSD